MERKVFIGGSDIAAVCGLSRWTTQLKLWAVKTGEIEPDDLSGFEAAELGSELEDFVAKKFERKTGIKVRVRNQEYIHPKYDFLKGHIDRKIEGKDELLECKTCSAYKAKEWEGEDIPMEYEMQVQMYLGLAGMKKGYIAVLIGGQKFVWKELKFDKELYDDMVSRAVAFWNDNVIGKEPPATMVGDKDVLAELYPDHTLDMIVLEERTVLVCNDHLKQRKKSKERIKEIEKVIEEGENIIKQLLESHEGFETEKFKVTWKSQLSTRVDTKALKEAGLYKKYSYSKDSRVFRVSEKKEK